MNPLRPAIWIAIAALWRNTLLTIGGGFAALYLLQHARIG